MRHLDIVLCGRSHALACLTQELEQMGHTAHLLTSDNAIELCRLPAPDLLIDDASTAQLPHYPSCHHLSLRAQSGDASDVFAPVQVDCLWRPGDGDWMLLGHRDVCANAAGNGADLAREAVAQVVEMASVHIGRFSRSVWRGVIVTMRPPMPGFWKRPNAPLYNAWPTACWPMPSATP